MILGRRRELELLENIYRSKESQFVTVYGRRRVGKTFLIREFFQHKKGHFFHLTGLQNGKIKGQLANFAKALSKTFHGSIPLKVPKNWSMAMEMLAKDIDQQEKMKFKGKIILFFDELPWLAVKKSGLMDQIDFYWNNQWSGLKNIIFIACGSSASWLLSNIIFHKGGLHNRTTLEINLRPFTLGEAYEYLKNKEVGLNYEQIMNLYMAIGGVPYYLNYVKRGLSAQENIQQIFFDENAPLFNEFGKLFQSLFDSAHAYEELIYLLAENKEGMGRKEIDKKAKYSSAGGYLTKRLQGLIDAGFIKEFTPFSKSIGSYYKLIDEYCLFYCKWLKDQGSFFDTHYWLTQSQRPSYYSWSGYAFEAICLKHYKEIIKKLGLKGIKNISAWRYQPRNSQEEGAQIDLVIDRLDDAITLCEIKYTKGLFTIDKSYAQNLRNKQKIFIENTGTTKQIFWCMITKMGIKKTIYANKMISNNIVITDLFK